MNLVQSIRFLLATGETHQYCSTQFNISDSLAKEIKQLAKGIPASALDGNGRETQMHVTVKYGLQGSIANNKLILERLLANERPIQITLGKTSYFSATQSSDWADVVVLEIYSPDMNRLNRLISNNLPSTENKFGQYKPHITLAYVKRGLGYKFAGCPSLFGIKETLSELQLCSKTEETIAIPLGRSNSIQAGGPGSGRHKEYGGFESWQKKPDIGLSMWRSKSGTSIVRRQVSPNQEEVLEYDKRKGLSQRRSFKNPQEASNHLSQRYGISAATVRRIVNPAPVDGPELYETRDSAGKILQQYRDRAGAEIAKEEGDRIRFKLGEGYPALKKAKMLRDGLVNPGDARLRNTTGGTGGTGGAGNG